MSLRVLTFHFQLRYPADSWCCLPKHVGVPLGAECLDKLTVV